MPISTYPQLPVDADAAIEIIYQAQADLTMLADWLAREPEPVAHQLNLDTLSNLCAFLERYMPSLRRH